MRRHFPSSPLALECSHQRCEMKRRVFVLGITVLFLTPALPEAGQTQEKYKVRLATVPMDGGMRGTVAGTGAATAVLAGAKLTVNGTFDGLLSPATTANVYRGPAMGVRGSSFAALAVSKE